MKFITYIGILTILTSLASCVQKTQQKNITVMVDMNGIENISQVGIRGTYPLSWNETTYLSDDNGDGIYENTFEIFTASQSIEFKFVNNNDSFELQNQNNRSLTFKYKPEVIVYKATYNNRNNIKITRQ